MANKIGERVETARKLSGYTQRKIAEKLGISYQTQNKYEKGHRTPTAGYLQLLANLTGLDAGWLLTGEGKMFERFLIKETKKTTIGDRIKYLRKSDKLIQKIFAFRLNIPLSELREIEKGTRKPDTELLKKILEHYYTRITEEWLLTGVATPPVEYAPRFCRDEVFEPMPAPIEKEKYYENVPLFEGYISCGPGTLPGDIKEWFLIPKKELPGGGDKYRYAAIAIKGISMAPLLVDGETVVIDRMDCEPDHLKQGSLYAVGKDGHSFVKRLDYDKSTNTLYLMSENQDYARQHGIEYVKLEKGMENPIMGKVVFSFRRWK